MRRATGCLSRKSLCAAKWKLLQPGSGPCRQVSEIPEDYVFDYIGDEGAPENVRMSELFRGGDTLMLYHYMFPRHASDTRPGPTGGSTAELPLEQGPCPSCTALIDMWEGTRCLISTVLEEISQSSPRPQ